MEDDVCGGGGERPVIIGFENAEKHEDADKQCPPNVEIICDKCLGSKYREKTGCTEEMCGQCTSCTRFYPLPNNLKDWLTYYLRQLKQFYYIKKYNIAYKIYKLIYNYLCYIIYYIIVYGADIFLILYYVVIYIM